MAFLLPVFAQAQIVEIQRVPLLELQVQITVEGIILERDSFIAISYRDFRFQDFDKIESFTLTRSQVIDFLTAAVRLSTAPDDNRSLAVAGKLQMRYKREALGGMLQTVPYGSDAMLRLSRKQIVKMRESILAFYGRTGTSDPKGAGMPDE